MSTPVAILNYATLKNNKLVLYTETKHNYVVGDYVHINGGFYDNTEKLINNIFNYNKDIINGGGTTFPLTLLQYSNGYKIIGFDPMLPSGYNFIIDYGYDTQDDVIYPYGNEINKFGRLDITNYAYRSKTEYTTHNKIFVHTNSLICGNIQNSVIKKTLIGVRDNNSLQEFYKCDNTKYISDSIIINSKFDNSIIKSSSISKNNILSIVDEYIDTTYPILKFQYLGVQNVSNKYSYNTKVERGIFTSCVISNIDLYNTHNRGNDVTISNCEINNSKIGNNLLINNTLQIYNNNTFNNCDINKAKFVSTGIKNIINNCDFNIKSVIKNIEIRNIDHDPTDTFSIMLVETFTKDIIQHYNDISIDHIYSFLDYNPTGSSVFDYDNTVKRNIELLPDTVKIQINTDQMSDKTQMVLIFSSKLPSINILDYNISDDMKLYEKDTSLLFNSLIINKSTIDTCILHNNDVTTNNNIFLGGIYDYVKINIFKAIGTSTNIIKLLLNNEYLINEGSTQSIENNKINYTYVNSTSTIYLSDIDNSFLNSKKDNYTNYKHGINIIGAKINHSIIEDSFLYHCIIFKTKSKRCLWDMCSIHDGPSNKPSEFKHVYNQNMLNNELLLENYIDDRTSTLPYQNHLPITIKLDIGKLSRNILITKTEKSILYDFASTYNGDLSNYAGGLYNSAIYNNNSTSEFALDLPILKNISNFVIVPLDLNNIGYPTQPIEVTTIAISSKKQSFRNTNKILCLNHIRTFLSANINTQYDDYTKKAQNTTYTPNSTKLLGSNPATLASGSIFELNDYKVDNSFIKTNTELNFPDLEDEKLYSFNLINGHMEYDSSVSTLIAPINLTNLPNINKFIPKIIFNAGGIDKENVGIQDETSNKIRYNDIDINSGINTITLDIDFSHYTKIDNVPLPLSVPEMIYEIERIYIYDENADIGESYVLRNTLNDIYTLSDQMVNSSSMLSSKKLKNDDGTFFTYNFLPSKSYLVYLDVWVTHHYIGTNNIVGNSFEINTNYNNIETTNMSGGNSYKIRLMVKVNTTTTLSYIVDHRSISDPDRFITTENDEKIIIL